MRTSTKWGLRVSGLFAAIVSAAGAVGAVLGGEPGLPLILPITFLPAIVVAGLMTKLINEGVIYIRRPRSTPDPSMRLSVKLALLTATGYFILFCAIVLVGVSIELARGDFEDGLILLAYLPLAIVGALLLGIGVMPIAEVARLLVLAITTFFKKPRYSG